MILLACSLTDQITLQFHHPICGIKMFRITLKIIDAGLTNYIEPMKWIKRPHEAQ